MLESKFSFSVSATQPSVLLFLNVKIGEKFQRDFKLTVIS